MACALFAAVHTVQLDNQIAEGQIQAAIEAQITTCEITNLNRAEAMAVALASVDEDRQIWQSIDDILIDGIPEPTRTVIFESLTTREERIVQTYTQRDCALITSETP